MSTFEFYVEGMPITQGSMKGIGRGRMVHSNKGLPAWRREIAFEAQKQIKAGYEPMDGPVEVRATFYLDRPKSHFKKSGELSAEGLRMTKPHKQRKGGGDLDKLIRAIGDSLSGEEIDGIVIGRLITDDVRITDAVISKRWAYDNDVMPGVALKVESDRGLPF